jgi:phenylalanyl-tRNA synthetase beta chain
MKFSDQWLREWVNPAISTQELADQITMAGLEVDGIEPAAGEFSGVIVGEIIAIEQHPDADKLRVCQVAGGEEPVQVVCGAPNAAKGLKIPFATVGAVLPGNFKIKKAKLRGVESFGMLCAASELGLSESSEGLLELAGDAPVGAGFREYLQLNDTIVEVDLTPNRGDCLSIKGLAREVGVLNKAEVTEVTIPEVTAQINDQISVELAAGDDCPRYLSRVIKGVNINAETPIWMAEKLRRAGVRCIDPVVDVTNYVMLELGQPMHAFDLSQVKGGIVVRKAKPEETLILLGGQELKLDSDALMIADHEKPLALAGIMGGEHSGVNEQTSDILLESAFFAPIKIAGRARRYGLHTDASHRYERGVDYELPRAAIERATALLLEVVGGQAGPVVEQTSAALPAQTQIELRRHRIKKILGFEIADAEVEDILSRLGMTLSQSEQGWQVSVPSYRFDITIEADLLEELARVYGYNNLPLQAVTAEMHLQAKPEAQVPLAELRRILVDRGYQEAITYSFVDPKLQKLIDPEVESVAVSNPISSDLSVMRTSLWPGLIAALQHNVKRQKTRVRLFESGLKFLPEKGGGRWRLSSTCLYCGHYYGRSWRGELGR